MSNSNQRPARLIAGFTALVFLWTSVAGTSPSASAQSLPAKDALLSFNVSTVQIPAQLGTIDERFNPPSSGKFQSPVIYIQDAHAVCDAQKSIQGLIDFLQKQYGLPLVAVEGAVGNLEPLLFRSFPIQSAREKVFNGLIRRGEISGVDAAAILNARWSDFVGIERKDLYEADRKAFIQALHAKTALLPELEQLLSAIQNQKTKIYSPELLKLDRLVEANESDSKKLWDLLKEVSKGDMSPKDFPNLHLVVQEMARDENLEEHQKAKGDVELAKLTGLVKSRLRKSEQQDFNQHHKDFLKVGNREAFVDFLIEKAKRLQISPQFYQQLSIRENSRARLQALTGQDFFKELHTLVERRKTSLFRSEEERKLDREFQDLKLLGKLASLELTREELKKALSLPPAYERPHRARAASLADAGGQAFSLARRFYELALERDGVLFENLLQAVQQKKAPFAAMVTGGFHAGGVKELLREKGIPFVVISPRIRETGESPYLDVMLEKNLSYQKYWTSQIAPPDELAPQLIGEERWRAVRRQRTEDLMQAARGSIPQSTPDFFRTWHNETTAQALKLGVNWQASRKEVEAAFSDYVGGHSNSIEGIDRTALRRIRNEFHRFFTRFEKPLTFPETPRRRAEVRSEPKEEISLIPIREATLEDVEALGDFREKEFLPNLRIPGGFLLDTLPFKDGMRKFLKGETPDVVGKVLVAVKDGEILGYSSAFKFGKGEFAHVEINEMAVSSLWYRQGLGTILFSKVLEWSRSLPGIHYIEVIDYSKKRISGHMAKRFGFTSIGKESYLLDLRVKGETADSAPRAEVRDNFIEKALELTGANEVYRLRLKTGWKRSPQKIEKSIILNKLILVDLRAFLKKRQYWLTYNQVGRRLVDLATQIGAHFDGNPFIRGDIGYPISEMLKNAFFHGNRYDFSKRILLKLEADTTGNIIKIHVFDESVKKKLSKRFMKQIAVPPELFMWEDEPITGAGVGINQIEKKGWIYKRENIRGFGTHAVVERSPKEGQVERDGSRAEVRLEGRMKDWASEFEAATRSAQSGDADQAEALSAAFIQKIEKTLPEENGFRQMIPWITNQGRDTTPKTALRVTSIALLNQVNEAPVSDEDAAHFEKMVDSYNQLPETLRPISPSMALVRGLIPIFKGKAEEAYIQASKNLAHVPDRWKARAVAWNLFLTGMHFNFRLIDNDYADFESVEDMAVWAIQKLSDPSFEGPDRRILMAGFLRFFMAYAPLLDPQHRLHSFVSPWIRKFQPAVMEHLEKIEGWLRKAVPEAEQTLDPLLAGLSWYFYDNFESYEEEYLQRVREINGLSPQVVRTPLDEMLLLREGGARDAYLKGLLKEIRERKPRNLSYQIDKAPWLYQETFHLMTHLKQLRESQPRAEVRTAEPYEIQLESLDKKGREWRATSDRGGIYSYQVRPAKQGDLKQKRMEEMIRSIYRSEEGARGALQELSIPISGSDDIEPDDVVILTNQNFQNLAGFYHYVPNANALMEIAVHRDYKQTGAVDILLEHLKQNLTQRQPANFRTSITRLPKTTEPKRGLLKLSINPGETSAQFAERVIANLKDALDIQSRVTILRAKVRTQAPSLETRTWDLKRGARIRIRMPNSAAQALLTFQEAFEDPQWGKQALFLVKTAPQILVKHNPIPEKGLELEVLGFLNRQRGRKTQRINWDRLTGFKSSFGNQILLYDLSKGGYQVSLPIEEIDLEKQEIRIRGPVKVVDVRPEARAEVRTKKEEVESREEQVDWVKRVEAFARSYSLQSEPGYRIEKEQYFDPDTKTFRRIHYRGYAAILLPGASEPLQTRLFEGGTPEEVRQKVARSLMAKLERRVKLPYPKKQNEYPFPIEGDDFLSALFRLVLALRWPWPVFEIERDEAQMPRKVTAILQLPGEKEPLRSDVILSPLPPKKGLFISHFLYYLNPSSQSLLRNIVKRFPQLVEDAGWILATPAGDLDYPGTLQLWAQRHGYQIHFDVRENLLGGEEAPWTGRIELIKPSTEPLQSIEVAGRRGNIYRRVNEDLVTRILGLRTPNVPFFEEIEKRWGGLGEVSAPYPIDYPIIEKMVGKVVIREPKQTLAKAPEGKQWTKLLSEFIEQNDLPNIPSGLPVLVTPFSEKGELPKITYHFGRTYLALVLGKEWVSSPLFAAERREDLEEPMAKSLLENLVKLRDEDPDGFRQFAVPEFPLPIGGDDFQGALIKWAYRAGWKKPIYRITKDPGGRVVKTQVAIEVPGSGEMSSALFPGGARDRAARDLLLRISQRYREILFEGAGLQRRWKAWLWRRRGGEKDYEASMHQWGVQNQRRDLRSHMELSQSPLGSVYRGRVELVGSGLEPIQSSLVEAASEEKARRLATREIAEKILGLKEPPIPSEDFKTLQKHQGKPVRIEVIYVEPPGIQLSRVSPEGRTVRAITDPQLKNGDRIEPDSLTGPLSIFNLHARRHQGGSLAWVGGVARSARLGRPIADYDIQGIAQLSEEERKIFSSAQDPITEPVQVVFKWGSRLLVHRADEMRRALSSFRESLDPIHWSGARPHQWGLFEDRLVEHTFGIAVTPEGDVLLSRPELSINTMALTMNNVFLDPWGGLQDLQHKTARFVGPLDRMGVDTILRGLRFKHALRLRWHPSAQAALKQASQILSQILKTGHPISEKAEQVRLARIWSGQAEDVFRDAPNPEEVYNELAELGFVDSLKKLGVDIKVLLERELTQRLQLDFAKEAEPFLSKYGGSYPAQMFKTGIIRGIPTPAGKNVSAQAPLEEILEDLYGGYRLFPGAGNASYEFKWDQGKGTVVLYVNFKLQSIRDEEIDAQYEIPSPPDVEEEILFYYHRQLRRYVPEEEYLPVRRAEVRANAEKAGAEPEIAPKSIWRERLRKVKILWSQENEAKFGKLKFLIEKYKNILGMQSFIPRLMTAYGNGNEAQFNETAGELFIAEAVENYFKAEGVPTEVLGLGLQIGYREFDVLLKVGNDLYLVEAKEDDSAKFEKIIESTLESQIVPQSDNAALLREAGVPVKGIVVAVGGKNSRPGVLTERSLPRSSIPIYSLVTRPFDVANDAPSQVLPPSPNESQIESWFNQKIDILSLFKNVLNPHFKIWKGLHERGGEEAERALRVLRRREGIRIRNTRARMAQKAVRKKERLREAETRANESDGWEISFQKAGIKAPDLEGILDWYFREQKKPLSDLRSALQRQWNSPQGPDPTRAWTWLKDQFEKSQLKESKPPAVSLEPKPRKAPIPKKTPERHWKEHIRDYTDPIVKALPEENPKAIEDVVARWLNQPSFKRGEGKNATPRTDLIAQAVRKFLEPSRRNVLSLENQDWEAIWRGMAFQDALLRIFTDDPKRPYSEKIAEAERMIQPIDAGRIHEWLGIVAARATEASTTRLIDLWAEKLKTSRLSREEKEALWKSTFQEADRQIVKEDWRMRDAVIGFLQELHSNQTRAEVRGEVEEFARRLDLVRYARPAGKLKAYETILLEPPFVERTDIQVKGIEPQEATLFDAGLSKDDLVFWESPEAPRIWRYLQTQNSQVEFEALNASLKVRSRRIPVAEFIRLTQEGKIQRLKMKETPGDLKPQDIWLDSNQPRIVIFADKWSRVNAALIAESWAERTSKANFIIADGGTNPLDAQGRLVPQKVVVVRSVGGAIVRIPLSLSSPQPVDYALITHQAPTALFQILKMAGIPANTDQGTLDLSSSKVAQLQTAEELGIPAKKVLLRFRPEDGETPATITEKLEKIQTSGIQKIFIQPHRGAWGWNSAAYDLSAPDQFNEAAKLIQAMLESHPNTWILVEEYIEAPDWKGAFENQAADIRVMVTRNAAKFETSLLKIVLRKPSYRKLNLLQLETRKPLSQTVQGLVFDATARFPLEFFLRKHTDLSEAQVERFLERVRERSLQWVEGLRQKDYQFDSMAVDFIVSRQRDKEGLPQFYFNEAASVFAGDQNWNEMAAQTQLVPKGSLREAHLQTALARARAHQQSRRAEMRAVWDADEIVNVFSADDLKVLSGLSPSSEMSFSSGDSEFFSLGSRWVVKRPWETFKETPEGKMDLLRNEAHIFRKIQRYAARKLAEEGKQGREGLYAPRYFNPGLWNEKLGGLVLRRLEGKTPTATTNRSDFLKMAREMVTAVAYLHEMKIAHIDIKPYNFIRLNDGRIVLVDFESAVVLDEKPGRYAKGTPHYMAPELWDNFTPNFSQDVYSLGITLAELWGDVEAKLMPYQSSWVILPFARHKTLSDVLGDHPLRDVILKATQTDHTKRYLDAIEMLKALSEQIEGPFGRRAEVRTVEEAAEVMARILSKSPERGETLPSHYLRDVNDLFSAILRQHSDLLRHANEEDFESQRRIIRGAFEGHWFRGYKESYRHLLFMRVLRALRMARRHLSDASPEKFQETLRLAMELLEKWLPPFLWYQEGHYASRLQNLTGGSTTMVIDPELIAPDSLAYYQGLKISLGGEPQALDHGSIRPDEFEALRSQLESLLRPPSSERIKLWAWLGFMVTFGLTEVGSLYVVFVLKLIQPPLALLGKFLLVVGFSLASGGLVRSLILGIHEKLQSPPVRKKQAERLLTEFAQAHRPASPRAEVRSKEEGPKTVREIQNMSWEELKNLSLFQNLKIEFEKQGDKEVFTDEQKKNAEERILKTFLLLTRDLPDRSQLEKAIFDQLPPIHDVKYQNMKESFINSFSLGLTLSAQILIIRTAMEVRMEGVLHKLLIGVIVLGVLFFSFLSVIFLLEMIAGLRGKLVRGFFHSERKYLALDPRYDSENFNRIVIHETAHLILEKMKSPKYKHLASTVEWFLHRNIQRYTANQSLPWGLKFVKYFMVVSGPKYFFQGRNSAKDYLSGLINEKEFRTSLQEVWPEQSTNFEESEKQEENYAAGDFVAGLLAGAEDILHAKGLSESDAKEFTGDLLLKALFKQRGDLIEALSALRTLPPEATRAEVRSSGDALLAQKVIEETEQTLHQASSDPTRKNLSAAIDTLGRLLKVSFDSAQLERLARATAKAQFRLVPNWGKRSFGSRMTEFLISTFNLKRFSKYNQLLESLYGISIFYKNIPEFQEALIKEESRLIEALYVLQEGERRRPTTDLNRQLRRDGIVAIALPDYLKFKELIRRNKEVELTIQTYGFPDLTRERKILLLTKSSLNSADLPILSWREKHNHGHTHPWDSLLGPIFSEPSPVDTEHAVFSWQRNSSKEFLVVPSPQGISKLWVYEGVWNVFKDERAIKEKLAELGITIPEENRRAEVRVSKREAAKRLKTALVRIYGAEIDDIDDNLTLLGSLQVPDEVISMIQKSIQSGIPRALASARPENASDFQKSLGAHDIAEIAARIRGGIPKENMHLLVLFPEIASYATWLEWNEKTGQFVRKEEDLVKRYGLVPADFELTPADRGILHQFLFEEAYDPDQLHIPFKKVEKKRYGMEFWIDTEDSAEARRQTDQLARKINRIFARYPFSKFHYLEAIPQGPVVDLRLKGLSKSLALRFFSERFGLKSSEIVGTDNKGIKGQDGWSLTRHSAGFSTDTFEPSSRHQIPLRLATGLQGVEAWQHLQSRLKFLAPVRLRLESFDSEITPWQSFEEVTTGLKTYFEKNETKILIVDRLALVALEKEDMEAYLAGRETPNATDHLFQLVGYGDKSQPGYHVLLELLAQPNFVEAASKTSYGKIKWKKYFSDQQLENVKHLLSSQESYESFKKVTSNSRLRAALLGSIKPQRIFVMEGGLVMTEEELAGVLTGSSSANRKLVLEKMNDSAEFGEFLRLLEKLLADRGWQLQVEKKQPAGRSLSKRRFEAQRKKVLEEITRHNPSGKVLTLDSVFQIGEGDVDFSHRFFELISSLKFQDEESKAHFADLIYGKIREKYGKEIASDKNQWVIITSSPYKRYNTVTYDVANKVAARIGIPHVTLRDTSGANDLLNLKKPYAAINTKEERERRLTRENELMKLAADPASVKDKNVIFIDDIVNTGITIKHAAKILTERYEAGPIHIVAIALLSAKNPRFESYLSTYLFQDRRWHRIGQILNRNLKDKSLQKNRMTLSVLFSKPTIIFDFTIVLLETEALKILEHLAREYLNPDDNDERMQHLHLLIQERTRAEVRKEDVRVNGENVFVAGRANQEKLQAQSPQAWHTRRQAPTNRFLLTSLKSPFSRLDSQDQYKADDAKKQSEGNKKPIGLLGIENQGGKIDRHKAQQGLGNVSASIGGQPNHDTQLLRNIYSGTSSPVSTQGRKIQPNQRVNVSDVTQAAFQERGRYQRTSPAKDRLNLMQVAPANRLRNLPPRSNRLITNLTKSIMEKEPNRELNISQENNYKKLIEEIKGEATGLLLASSREEVKEDVEAMMPSWMSVSPEEIDQLTDRIFNHLREIRSAWGEIPLAEAGIEWKEEVMRQDPAGVKQAATVILKPIYDLVTPLISNRSKRVILRIESAGEKQEFLGKLLPRMTSLKDELLVMTQPKQGALKQVAQRIITENQKRTGRNPVKFPPASGAEDKDILIDILRLYQGGKARGMAVVVVTQKNLQQAFNQVRHNSDEIPEVLRPDVDDLMAFLTVELPGILEDLQRKKGQERVAGLLLQLKERGVVVKTQNDTFTVALDPQIVQQLLAEIKGIQAARASA